MKLLGLKTGESMLNESVDDDLVLYIAEARATGVGPPAEIAASLEPPSEALVFEEVARSVCNIDI